ncbi:sulfite exporter TauE/SafE family protein [Pseudogemmobacter sonorensis]|uniref:sulfite exporter TauE/SafE family protein n=1 Tax=Pseudogemmobacter sonorensis TaxID=2989681 RepID=UPI0036A409B6
MHAPNILQHVLAALADPQVWTTGGLVVASVLASAFLRGLTGFGFAIAAVPVMSLAVDPAVAVAVAVLLQLLIGLQDVFSLRGQFDRPEVMRLSGGAVIGTPIGVMALSLLSADEARILIAAVVLLGVAFLLRRPSAARPERKRPSSSVAMGAGVLAGAFSGMAAMPGPPAVAYFLGTDTPPAMARASLMMFFFVAALLATPGLAFAGLISGKVLALTALGWPALIIGTRAGAAGFRRLGQGHYRLIALMVMVLSAVLSGWRGFVALTGL